TDRTRAAFGFRDLALTFRTGELLDALALDLCLLQYGRNQFFFMAQDFRLLHLDLLLFFDLLDLYRLRGHQLLLDIGLDLIRFVRLRLLTFDAFEIFSALDLEIARRFRLL